MHSHGLFGRDGGQPAEMIATARSQVLAYPSVRFVEGVATKAAMTADGFAVTLQTGDVVEASKLVLAFGISDDLPAIPGLAPRWGRSVLHCPYCHGFEFSGQRLGVLHVTPMSIHQAMLIADWGPTTLYLNGAPEPDEETLAELSRRGVTIEPAPIRRLHGEGIELSAIELADGRTSAVDALYIGTRTRFNSDIATQLGCAVDQGPSGPVLRTDAEKMTSVPGVYAAGDITRAVHNITWASADGVTAGVALHRAMVFEPARS
jgi:thioredoxin reductase